MTNPLGRFANQVSPPPHIARLAHIDTAALIQRAIRQHPDWTPDDITTLIRSWGIPVSGICVARTKQLIRQQTNHRVAA